LCTELGEKQMIYLKNIEMISTTVKYTILTVIFLYLEGTQFKFQLADWLVENIFLGSIVDTAYVDIEP
jgi:hypothetical protein